MTKETALSTVKDLLEYCTTHAITELQTEEYDAPLLGEGMKAKKITKIEYVIRTIETPISPESINEQIQSINSQMTDLTIEKQKIAQIGEEIKTMQ